MSDTAVNSSALSLMALCLSSSLLSAPAQAQPVWHCTRSSLQIADSGADFTLAALDVEREVMRISLRDLYAVYQGETVMASGLNVSACLVGGNNPTTKNAMMSIGANAQLLESASSKSASVFSNVYLIQSEQDMQACMTQHYPAIGYLPQATHTEAIGPCF